MKVEHVTGREWISSRDKAVRDTHDELDGTIIPVDGRYQIPGTNGLRYPGDPEGEDKEIKGCRCVEAPFVDFDAEKPEIDEPEELAATPPTPVVPPPPPAPIHHHFDFMRSRKRVVTMKTGPDGLPESAVIEEVPESAVIKEVPDA
jgi:hypothetical protein